MTSKQVDEELDALPESPSGAKQDVEPRTTESQAETRLKKWRYLCIFGSVLAIAVVAVVCAVALTNGETSGSSKNASNGDMSFRGIPPSTSVPTSSNAHSVGDGGGDEFELYNETGITNTLVAPVSTFSADVDTASYSYVRRYLRTSSQKPPSDAVRAEEFINYFDYDYPQTTNKDVPFQPTVMVSESPWNTGRKLMHIGIKGYDVEPDERPRSNIVFLIDVSGSMSSKDKLPLAKESIRLLLGIMDERDMVSIVTYASTTAVALYPTAVTSEGRATVKSTLLSLEAGGSTSGGGGIELAYSLAEDNFDADAINRIILVTDGDFNVGRSDPSSLRALIEEKRLSGIFLSVLGFGMGNYHDTTMKALANHGNGIAAYIDSLEEAHKVMVTEAYSSVFPIAKDVKFQVEFNPTRVAEYRLVGYEKRILDQEDFDNDNVDAGHIGSGHTVTAIYEIALVADLDTAVKLRSTNGTADGSATGSLAEEYAVLKIRYKLPDQDQSMLLRQTISPDKNHVDKFAEDPLLSDVINEFAFATAVAGFAQLLKGGEYLRTGYGFAEVLELAIANRGVDPFNYRLEFVELVQKAQEVVAV